MKGCIDYKLNTKGSQKIFLLKSFTKSCDKHLKKLIQQVHQHRTRSRSLQRSPARHTTLCLRCKPFRLRKLPLWARFHSNRRRTSDSRLGAGNVGAQLSDRPCLAFRCRPPDTWSRHPAFCFDLGTYRGWWRLAMCKFQFLRRSAVPARTLSRRAILHHKWRKRRKRLGRDARKLRFCVCRIHLFGLFPLKWNFSSRFEQTA